MSDGEGRLIVLSYSSGSATRKILARAMFTDNYLPGQLQRTLTLLGMMLSVELSGKYSCEKRLTSE